MGQAADRAAELLGPLVTRDETGLVADLAAALVAGDEEMTLLLDRLGVAAYLAPAVAPGRWLPWLAGVAGARIAAGMSEAQQRAEVEMPTGWRRGRPATILAAVAPFLAPPRRVQLRERFNPESPGDAADHALLQVQASDVLPGMAAALTAAFHAALPVDVTGHVVITDQRIYADLPEVGDGEYDDIKDLGTYDDVLNP